MNDDKVCLHLTLKRLASDSPANQLHSGTEAAYYCHDCGSTFFPTLIPATIDVSYGKPEDKPVPITLNAVLDVVDETYRRNVSEENWHSRVKNSLIVKFGDVVQKGVITS